MWLCLCAAGVCVCVGVRAGVPGRGRGQFECEKGFTGYLCSKCAPSYTAVKLNCKPCSSPALVVSGVLAAAIILWWVRVARLSSALGHGPPGVAGWGMLPGACDVWWDACHVRWDACHVRWDTCHVRWDTCHVRWDACDVRWDACDARWEGWSPQQGNKVHGECFCVETHAFTEPTHRLRDTHPHPNLFHIWAMRYCACCTVVLAALLATHCPRNGPYAPWCLCARACVLASLYLRSLLVPTSGCGTSKSFMFYLQVRGCAHGAWLPLLPHCSWEREGWVACGGGVTMSCRIMPPPPSPHGRGASLPPCSCAAGKHPADPAAFPADH
jgi:hypothetical protein